MHSTYEQTSLTEADARVLLQQHGFGMRNPFGHVHATQTDWEVHVCLLTDLERITAAQFLTRLKVACQFTYQNQIKKPVGPRSR